MKDLIKARNIVAAINFIIAIIFAAVALSDNLTNASAIILSILLITFATATFILTVYLAIAKSNNSTKK